MCCEPTCSSGVSESLSTISPTSSRDTWGRCRSTVDCSGSGHNLTRPLLLEPPPTAASAHSTTRRHAARPNSARMPAQSRLAGSGRPAGLAAAPSATPRTLSCPASHPAGAAAGEAGRHGYSWGLGCGRWCSVRVPACGLSRGERHAVQIDSHKCPTAPSFLRRLRRMHHAARRQQAARLQHTPTLSRPALAPSPPPGAPRPGPCWRCPGLPARQRWRCCAASRAELREEATGVRRHWCMP